MITSTLLSLCLCLSATAVLLLAVAIVRPWRASSSSVSLPLLEVQLVVVEEHRVPPQLVVPLLALRSTTVSRHCLCSK
ncbi:hypothetical protein Sjap_011336 [Stephania japonica]|uniref:Secreted peptide n=1 Tax=Stephania japonica TaxID=461633 RepID=A0AAP0JBG9_9MAGN